jgi:hypothetical protein
MQHDAVYEATQANAEQDTGQYQCPAIGGRVT